ncbi:MAG: hypothetical protein CM1200mP9_11980 [Gammaproteobacteria bacterium]|nr:MAG: hypothetical protein CM1200mP9_11980 [Gammaproteobacteria bacterium]
MDLGELGDTSAAANNQAVEINTIAAMRSLFDGELGAFSYLLFVLLYMPCVATIGAIYKELGRSGPSLVQPGASSSPTPPQSFVISSAAWLITPCRLSFGASACFPGRFMFTALIRWGVRRAKTDTLIPVLHLE